MLLEICLKPLRFRINKIHSKFLTVSHQLILSHKTLVSVRQIKLISAWKLFTLILAITYPKIRTSNSYPASSRRRSGQRLCGLLGSYLFRVWVKNEDAKEDNIESMKNLVKPWSGKFRIIIYRFYFHISYRKLMSN